LQHHLFITVSETVDKGFNLSKLLLSESLVWSD